MYRIYADINLFIRRTEAGKHLAPAVTVGDRVLLPEFGGAKVTYVLLTCFLGEFLFVTHAFHLESRKNYRKGMVRKKFIRFRGIIL
jgi:hypothetical protein